MTTTRVEQLLRQLALQLLGALTRWRGQFDACEDAVQEVLLAAVSSWPIAGVLARSGTHGVHVDVAQCRRRRFGRDVPLDRQRHPDAPHTPLTRRAVMHVIHLAAVIVVILGSTATAV